MGPSSLVIKGLPSTLLRHFKTREALVADKEGEVADGTYSFPSVVEMLQYLRSHSRPGITFAVSQCARFTQNPGKSHEVALKRSGQYLKSTMEDDLVLAPNAMLYIDCFVDADFAGLWPHEEKLDSSCVRSRTGFVIFVANCPIIWSSKPRTDIATSTMKAEYYA